MRNMEVLLALVLHRFDACQLQDVFYLQKNNVYICMYVQYMLYAIQ